MTHERDRPDDTPVRELVLEARPCADSLLTRRAVARARIALVPEGGVTLTDADLHPTLAGRYILLRELGTGTGGSVYDAFDRELDRKVAVKILHDTSARAAGEPRLLEEARTLARIAHPNVVAVHDVGVYRDPCDPHPRTGGVFIVMDLVEGGDLSTTIAALGTRARAARWRPALAAMLQAGRGLAAAHRAGIVHGDFKPANVLVGRDGRVVVADFGLAGGARAREAFGAPGRFAVGTPAYMAPEQHRGAPASSLADQYAYCVTLLEALSGARPFASATTSDLLADKESVRVAVTPSGVPNWLLRSVMRGLAPVREHRHASMDALINELEQGLARRRNLRIAAAFTSATVTLALTVALALGRTGDACATDEQLAGVWDDDGRARVRAALVATATPYAADVAEGVEHRLDAYAQQWTSSWQHACDTLASRDTSRTLYCLEGRRSALAQITRVLSRADATVAAQAPDMIAELPPPDACASHHLVVDPPTDPADQREALTLEAELVRAEALLVQAHYAQSEELLRTILDRAAGVHMPALGARALLLSGRLRRVRGEPREAEATFFQAQALAEQLGDVGIAVDAEIALVGLLTSAGQLDIAEHIARQAEGRIRYHELGDAVLAKLLHARGALRAAQARFEEAERDLHGAAELAQKIYGAASVQSVSIAVGLGHVLVARGRYAEAFDVYGAAVERAAELTGTRHPLYALALAGRAHALIEQAQFEDAKPLLAEASAILDATMGSSHPINGLLHARIGTLLQGLGDYEGAVQRLRLAQEVTRERTEDDQQMGWLHNNLCYALCEQERHDEALASCTRAVSALEGRLGLENPWLAVPYNNLGEALLGVGRVDEALVWLDRSLAIRLERFPADHPHLGYSYFNLGRAHLALGRNEQAVEELGRALELWSESLGASHPRLAGPLVSMGLAYSRLEQSGTATQHLEQAVDLLEEAGHDEHRLARARFELARVARTERR